MNTRQKGALKQIAQILAPFPRSESIALLAETRKIVNEKPDDGGFPGQPCPECKEDTLNMRGECPACIRLLRKRNRTEIRVGQSRS